jgi:hypothetical protein
LIAAFSVVLVLLLASLDLPVRATPAALPPAAPLPQSANFVFDPATLEIDPSGQVNASAVLQNTGNTTDTFAISTNIANFPGWTATPSSASVTLGPGASTNISFLITAPADASGSVTLTATATSTAGDFNAFLTLNVTTPGTVDIQLAVRGDREKEGTPGSTVEYTIRLQNTGEATVDVDLSIDGVVSCSRELGDQCLDSVSQGTIENLEANESRDFTVSVLLPNDAEAGIRATTRVVAVARPSEPLANDTREDEENIDVFTTVLEASPTRTPSPTPSETTTPVPTLAPICSDNFENDDDRGSSKVIDVNLPQPQNDPPDPEIDDRRTICPAGDEDWLVFGGVEGKVYTIDILRAALGLDLTLGLYDEDGERLAFNDDFYNREPNNPDDKDINPRIESWTAPYTGRFYIRVRDAAGRGGVDRTYRIILRAESYGPTPQTVVEVCEDIYEPDGLPEQAQLITSNELQPDRRLCPTGDADWVTFFGKAGKRYFIYTNTEIYADDPVNDTFDVQAGADTVLVLTDRDGVSVIDVNDDIPGGDTLDSQIEFLPDVDGFYFAQVKNVGDIGNQFIRYDLTLELCIPGAVECGRDISFSAQSVPGPAPAPQSGPAPAPESAPTIVRGVESMQEQAATPTPTYTPVGQ